MNKTTDELYKKCTNAEMLEKIDGCPEILNELKKKYQHLLIDAYDAILPEYGMSFLAFPVYKNDYNDDIAYFSYRYMIDNNKYEMSGDQGYKTMAEAQLEAVHETMYELQKRIRNGQNVSL